MKVHYTGKLEKLEPAGQKKLDARFTKLGKLLDKKSEKEAHVILAAERHATRAEITINYNGHSLCGAHAEADSLSALTGALDRLEKQILKLQAKTREPRRGGKISSATLAPELPPAEEPAPARVFRGKVVRKPMSVEEAAMELDGVRPYIAFRDSRSEKVSVLIRRPDGHLDLIEAN